jgi:hypothetical protein
MANNELSIISFNLHGLNQAKDAILELIDVVKPLCLCLQEHWLISDNLCQLDIDPDYFVVASPALRFASERGPVIGRPAGGIATLINRNCISSTRVLLNSDRCIIVECAGKLVANVYLPCIGSDNRLSICSEILSDIDYCFSSSSCRSFVLAGDFNVDLQASLSHKRSNYELMILEFLCKYQLVSAFDTRPDTNFVSYYNEKLGHSSLIDYFFVNELSSVLDVRVFEPMLSYSDHFPIVCSFALATTNNIAPNVKLSSEPSTITAALRWDMGDVVCYYDSTRIGLEPVYEQLKQMDEQRHKLITSDIVASIDSLLNVVVSVLTSSADCYVPRLHRNALKSWWDDELRELKRLSVQSEDA